MIERIMNKPGYKLLAVFAVFAMVGTIEYRDELEREKLNNDRAEMMAIINARAESDAKQYRDYEEYLRKYGHPTPAIAAKAVKEKAKKPKIMLALVATEGAAPDQYGRDGAGSLGMGQVIPKYWGAVSSDPSSQIEQSERILDELVEASGSLRGGLKRYNGSDAYAVKVLRRVEDAP